MSEPADVAAVYHLHDDSHLTVAAMLRTSFGEVEGSDLKAQEI